jgi:hypothetical protein
MALDAQLQELLRDPQERPDVELKSWLDLADNGPRATLAKAIIAIANHGGGFVLLGFEDNGAISPRRPGALNSYSQDAVNDVIDRFADPGFHCVVHHVIRNTDGLSYPIIVVPGGHRVPIRSKRGSANNEIQADRYYVRRPGPASEPPQTGREWDELIRRCVRNSTDEIASLVRDVLEGRSPKAEPKADSPALLEQWQAASMTRWHELTDALPPNHAARFPRGWYSVSYLVEGLELTLADLRDALQTADRTRLTGWPPWWFATRAELAPYVHEDTVECWLGARDDADAAHADFWRASSRGELFLIRGYIEDALANRSGAPRVEPGTVFDLTLPVWRVGECLLHAARFAAATARPEASVVVRVEWAGLAGRTLTVLQGTRWLFDDHRARGDSRTSRLTVPASKITPVQLPEIVKELVQPLLLMFGFFEPPEGLYAEELGRMLRREF